MFINSLLPVRIYHLKMEVHIPRELLLVSLLFVFGGSMNLGLETNDVTDNYISTKINWLFDKFLIAYKEELIIKGKTEVPVQNFEEHFSSKVFIFNIDGYMSVENGSIKNLTSLQRTGDVTLDRDGHNITLTAHIGLTDFQIKYQKYELSLMGLTQSGSISGVVGSNSVSLKVVVITHPECKVHLASLDLEKLENIDIDITGLGPMNTLTDDISSWVVTHIAHSYKTSLQDFIFADIDKAIQDADLCHHFPIVS